MGAKPCSLIHRHCFIIIQHKLEKGEGPILCQSNIMTGSHWSVSSYAMPDNHLCTCLCVRACIECSLFDIPTRTYACARYGSAHVNQPFPLGAITNRQREA